jgi:5-methylcytosine-specific restriction endonuclease McrA
VQAEKKPKKKREWSQQAAIYSALRRADRNSPMWRGTLTKAKSEYFVLSKKGKQLRRVHFECANCHEKFSRKQINVDHIQPVVNPETGTTTLDGYVARLFVPIEARQVLCKPCHKAKSKIENRVRRMAKKSLR